MKKNKLIALFIFMIISLTVFTGSVSAATTITVESQTVVGLNQVVTIPISVTTDLQLTGFEVAIDQLVDNATIVMNTSYMPVTAWSYYKFGDCVEQGYESYINAVGMGSAADLSTKTDIFAINVTPVSYGKIPLNIVFGYITDSMDENHFINDDDVTVVNGTLTVTRAAHTITASAGEHGSITPSGAVTVEEGTDKTFTIEADSGYVIDSLKVDEVSVDRTASYEFKDVVADHTIEATFKKAPLPEFTITVSAGENGSITPSGAVPVTQNENKSFTITANPGYEIADITVDGNLVPYSGGNLSYIYTFTNVIVAHTISANFTAEAPICIDDVIYSSNPTVGVPVIFIANVSTENPRAKSLALTWTFDDGTKATWEFNNVNEATGVVEKTFAKAGTYKVTVSAESKMNGLTNSTEFSLTVNEAKKQQTNPKTSNVTNASGVIIPDVEIPVITFDASDVNASVGLNVTIDKYVKDPTTEMTGKTVPNSADVLLYMNVSVVEGAEKDNLKSYAKVIINITNLRTVAKEDISFFRFADGATIGEMLSSRILDYGTGWAKYEVMVPGFSAIVASVNEVTPATPEYPYVPGDDGDDNTPSTNPTKTPTPKKTATPVVTQTPVKTQVPSTPVKTQVPSTPVKTQTQPAPAQTSSPAPFIGIVAALGAVALVLRRK